MKKSRRHKTAEDLPEFIIQDIQSFLERSDGIRSCLLSKSWLRASSTIPTLRFHEHQVSEPKRKSFDDTILRYQEHNLLIEKLFLNLGSVDDNLDSYLNKWLNIATQGGLKVLDLLGWRISFKIPFAIFSCKTLRSISVYGCSLEMPAQHMINCSSLVSLRLCNVDMDDRAISLLFSCCSLIEEIRLSCCKGLENIRLASLGRLKKFEIVSYFGNPIAIHELDCHSLANLKLFRVTVDEEVACKLVSSCPLIENINLNACTGLEKSRLGNLPKLNGLQIDSLNISLRELESQSLSTLVLYNVDVDQQELDHLFPKCPCIVELSLNCCKGLSEIKVAELHHLKRLTIFSCPIENLEISAPCLRSLIIRECYPQSNDLLFNIDYPECLTQLELEGLQMIDKFFDEFLSKVPFLEQLTVACCDILGHINIANQLLHDLTIAECAKLKEVKVHSPNLSHLWYTGEMLPTFAFTNGSSTQLKTNVALHEENLDTSCSLMLRDLLAKSLQLLLWVNIYNVDLDLDGLRELSPPVKNVEEFSLIISECPSEKFRMIMEAIFSICRPNYACVLYHGENSGESLLREVIERRKLDCCTSHDERKCWRHYLRGSEIWMPEEGALDNKLFQQPCFIKFQKIALTLKWSG